MRSLTLFPTSRRSGPGADRDSRGLSGCVNLHQEYGMQDRVTTRSRKHADNARPRPNTDSARGAGAGERQGRRSDRMRILIVDNDMDSADALNSCCMRWGYAGTRVAYSGEACSPSRPTSGPAWSCSDSQPARHDGLPSGAAAARLGHRSRGVRLIALTSSPEHAGREEARAAGFNAISSSRSLRWNFRT